MRIERERWGTARIPSRIRIRDITIRDYSPVLADAQKWHVQASKTIVMQMRE